MRLQKYLFILSLGFALLLSCTAAHAVGEENRFSIGFSKKVIIEFNDKFNARMLISDAHPFDADDAAVNTWSSGTRARFFFQHAQQHSSFWTLERTLPALMSLPLHYLSRLPINPFSVWFVERKGQSKHRLLGWKDANLLYKGQLIFHP